jgi:hypothetical protein
MLKAMFRGAMAIDARMASAHMWANIGRRFELPNTNNTSTSSSTWRPRTRSRSTWGAPQRLPGRRQSVSPSR